jgi:DNA repair protein RadC
MKPLFEPNPNQGHRQRLRDKFLKSGLAGFHDYEIVELLLTLSSPRRDCKQPAKDAMQRFKTLRGVLEAPPEELGKIKGIGPVNAFAMKLVQEVAREFLKEKILGQPIYQSSQQVFDYLYHSMRDLKKRSLQGTPFKQPEPDYGDSGSGRGHG